MEREISDSGRCADTKLLCFVLVHGAAHKGCGCRAPYLDVPWWPSLHSPWAEPTRMTTRIMILIVDVFTFLPPNTLCLCPNSFLFAKSEQFEGVRHPYYRSE